MNSKVFAAFILSIFALSTVAIAVVPARAEPQIYVQNPLTADGNFIFSTDTTSVGFKFNATVWATAFVDPAVYAWQVTMYYNNTILNATRAFLPAASDPDYILFGHSTARPKPSFASNYVKIGDTSLDTSVTSATPKKLAIIEFQIMLAPTTGNKLSCNLDINNVDTYLLDDFLSEITATKTGGYYEFSAPVIVRNITITTDKSQVTVGSTVTVSGSVTPVTAGANVTIFYKLSNVSSWSTLAFAMTDPSGHYAYPWITSSEGTFDLKSGWVDVNSTVVSVTVLPKPVKTFDVTGDGKVDIKDIASVAQAFGAYYYPPNIDPRYNPAYDFDNNNVIDMIDIVMIAKHFGMTV
jgi:hypothetical protein